MKFFFFLVPIGLMMIYASVSGLFHSAVDVGMSPQRLGDSLEIIAPKQSLLVGSEGIAFVNQQDHRWVFYLLSPAMRAYFWIPCFFDRIVIAEWSLGATDHDQDGFPDIAELYGEDCAVFRQWFVGIATHQKAHMSPLWKDRDCSGLVRFAYREALRQHDAAWAERTQIPILFPRDIQAFHYPNIPELGDQIFRTESGFGTFANAHNLLLYHCRKVDRHVSDRIKPGDLMFFFHPQDLLFPYHVMIFTGDGLVYHTGPTDDSEGEMRLWRWDDYFQGAPLEWLPTRENPYFLGFYRFKILND
jgi:hypothetical protein